MSSVYVIADEQHIVMSILVPMGDKKHEVCAIFLFEEDALEYLWGCQDQLERPHAVYKLPTFLAAEEFK